MDHRERLELVRHLLRWAYQKTAAFEAGGHAPRFCHLLMAIVEDSHIQLDPTDPHDDAFVRLLSEDMEIWHGVSKYMQPAP